MAALCLFAACEDHDDFLPDNSKEMRAGAGLTDSLEETPVLPKKQLRGVWIATVYGIDWPNGYYYAFSQKRLYTKYLDSLASLNINAVFFQVRPMADAFYDSQFEPWSKYITGTAGKKPSYDVLKFLIDEAHKRCISFHAWINPYRIEKKSESASFSTLDKRIPKSIVKDYKTIRVYNPALPETRARLDSIVKDLIEKYDVDGIHMDDYFYPSLTSGESMGDDAEYAKYGSGYSSIENWRRGNITQMVTSLQKTIRNTRREVVFSVSPQGNIENDENSQYADVKKWMSARLIDLMIPQIYYKTGTSYYDFNKRVAQWASLAKKCPLAVGYPIYRYDPDYGSAFAVNDSSMLVEQFQLADAQSNISGDVHYSMKYIISNPRDIKAVLRARYAKKALIPFYGNYTSVKPASPSNLKILNVDNLTWDVVDGAYYAVYRSNGDKQEATLVEVTRNTTYVMPEDGKYFVTAVNKKDNSESAISEIVRFNRAEQTIGITPVKIK